jgi:hypothetical protein
VHICFGYAAMVAQRPSGYSFLPELRGCGCKQVSIETAQSQLDCSVLAQLDDKQIMVGCIDLSDPAVESPEVIAARIRRALPFVAKERVILAPDCGMKYLPRETAVGKLRAMVLGGAAAAAGVRVGLNEAVRLSGRMVPAVAGCAAHGIGIWRSLEWAPLPDSGGMQPATRGSIAPRSPDP